MFVIEQQGKVVAKTKTYAQALDKAIALAYKQDALPRQATKTQMNKLTLDIREV